LAPGRLRSAQITILLCAANTAAFVAFPAVSDGISAWLALRAVSGMASGLAFIMAVNTMAGSLAAHREKWLPFFGFSGVGFGIAAGAVGCLAAGDDWREAWRICGGISGFSCFFMVLILAAMGRRQPAATAAAGRHAHHAHHAHRYPWFLLFGYTVEGGAYIVTATFLVLGIVGENIVPVEYAGWYWVGFGLVTAPSTLLWAKAVARFGYGHSLAAAFWLQMAGALLATCGQVYVLALATLLLGGTFMGITSIALLWTRTLGGAASNLATQLTLAYSMAQLVTPVLSGISLQSTGGVNHAYAASAIALGLAGIAIWRAVSMHTRA
jgi:hypothetical protein